MGHWRINGVPCCQSKWTGSELHKTCGEAGMQAPAFKCGCSFEEYGEMRDQLNKIFASVLLEFDYLDESCPGDHYWDVVRFDARADLLGKWAAKHLPGYFVDKKSSMEELFVLRLSKEEWKTLYVIRVPLNGWVLLRAHPASPTLDQDELNTAGRE